MVIGSEIMELLRNSSYIEPESPRKNAGNDNKLNDLSAVKNKDRTRELLSPFKKHRQSAANFTNFKYKSNQKANNLKMKLINISETSSDNNNDNNDKNTNKKSKNNPNKNKLNEINEQTNNNSIHNNFNESKKNKNKSNKSNILFIT